MNVIHLAPFLFFQKFAAVRGYGSMIRFENVKERRVVLPGRQNAKCI